MQKPRIPPHPTTKQEILFLRRMGFPAQKKMNVIDGYYFSTRYPGNESFIPSTRDIDKANSAVENARDFTLQICREMEENHDIDEEYDDYSDFEYDNEL